MPKHPQIAASLRSEAALQMIHQREMMGTYNALTELATAPPHRIVRALLMHTPEHQEQVLEALHAACRHYADWRGEGLQSLPAMALAVFMGNAHNPREVAR
jgi:hypothetical protein